MLWECVSFLQACLYLGDSIMLEYGLLLETLQYLANVN